MGVIRSDEEQMENSCKNLSNFDTRIVSTIRASPGAFAKILAKEDLYQDYRFNTHHKISENKLEMEIKEKLRKKLESEFLKHSRDGDIESRRGNYAPQEANLKINKDTIKIVTAYDRKNERYIICEKSYTL